MHNTTTRLYGLDIHVGSRLGTKISVIYRPEPPYILMDQDLYDLLIISVAKEEGFADDWIDDQLTRPRDDLFKSLANHEFYMKLLGIVHDLRRRAWDISGDRI